MNERPGRPDDLRRGAAFAVLAAAAFAAMAACVKTAAATMPNEVIVFFRSATSLVVLLPWLLLQGPVALKTRRPWAHLWRAAFGTVAVYSFFYAIAHLTLAEAILLTYSTPLFIPFIGWIAIREVPPPVIFPAVATGLVGIALIVKPGGASLVSVASAVGALSGVMAACAMVTIRRISDTEPAARIVFYFSGLSALIASVPLLWTWRAPDTATLILLVVIGVLATLGQLLLTHAYSLAPAARIGAFAYVSVVFGGLIGWALWGETPDGLSVLGMLLVVTCCLLAGWQRA